jgi:AraC-like DNA-binding protein
MDALGIILRIVRETIQASGVPPDAVQDALAEAERRSRRSLGGAMHHISRVPQVLAKEQIIELAAQDLSAQQISQRVGVSDRYVRRILRLLRVE